MKHYSHIGKFFGEMGEVPEGKTLLAGFLELQDFLFELGDSLFDVISVKLGQVFIET